MTISAPTTTPDWRGYYIEPYPGMAATELIEESCDLCDGAPRFDGPSIGQKDPARCSACDGDGIRSRTVAALRQDAVDIAHARADHVDAMRQLRVRRAMFERTQPGLAAALTTAHHGMRGSDPLAEQLRILLGILNDETGALTPDQVHLARTVLDACARAAAALRPVPFGRTILRGRIIGVRSLDSQWGPTTSLLLQGRGWQASGPRPAGGENLACGDVVEITATVAVDELDRSVGHWSRPTTVRIIATGVRRPAA